MEEDPHFAAVIASFRYIRCNFKKHQRAEQYIYESLSPSVKSLSLHLWILILPSSWSKTLTLIYLGLANRRAEKTKPSCLDFVLIFREAARIKREAAPHVSLRDCVWGAVAEYNKTVTKEWRWNCFETVLKLVFTKNITCFMSSLMTLQSTLRTGVWKMMFAVWHTTWWDVRLSYWTSLGKCVSSPSLRMQASFLKLLCDVLNLYYIHYCVLYCSLSAMCIENLDGDYYIPGSRPDSAEGVWKEAQVRHG